MGGAIVPGPGTAARLSGAWVTVAVGGRGPIWVGGRSPGWVSGVDECSGLTVS